MTISLRRVRKTAIRFLVMEMLTELEWRTGLNIPSTILFRGDHDPPAGTEAF